MNGNKGEDEKQKAGEGEGEVAAARTACARQAFVENFRGLAQYLLLVQDVSRGHDAPEVTAFHRCHVLFLNLGKKKEQLYRSCIALFYRKRLLQQNGDR
jgi:hypothetical protein